MKVIFKCHSKLCLKHPHRENFIYFLAEFSYVNSTQFFCIIDKILFISSSRNLVLPANVLVIVDINFFVSIYPFFCLSILFLTTENDCIRLFDDMTVTVSN